MQIARDEQARFLRLAHRGGRRVVHLPQQSAKQAILFGTLQRRGVEKGQDGFEGGFVVERIVHRKLLRSSGKRRGAATVQP
ncbi:MAG: hypothetical protein BGN86_15435 [Caulobacterales bacterium 68-7]|nr:MAG: hypothetical protein BGN86_15435 [Caulobacterales bacterium 68-7]